MQRKESEYIQPQLDFADEIVIKNSEHDLPEIWINEQLLANFLEFLKRQKKNVLRKEIIDESKSDVLVNNYRVVLHDELDKDQRLKLVRDFLDSIPTDWIEIVHETSEYPLRLILPDYEIKKNRS